MAMILNGVFAPHVYKMPKDFAAVHMDGLQKVAHRRSVKSPGLATNRQAHLIAV